MEDMILLIIFDNTKDMHLDDEKCTQYLPSTSSRR